MFFHQLCHCENSSEGETPTKNKTIFTWKVNEVSTTDQENKEHTLESVIQTSANRMNQLSDYPIPIVAHANQDNS